MVQQWVDTQTGGAVTIRRNVNVLAQILDYVVRDGALKTNPARDLILPTKSRGVHVFLTAEQLQHLATHCYVHRVFGHGVRCLLGQGVHGVLGHF